MAQLGDLPVDLDGRQPQLAIMVQLDSELLVVPGRTLHRLHRCQLLGQAIGLGSHALADGGGLGQTGDLDHLGLGLLARGLGEQARLESLGSGVVALGLGQTLRPNRVGDGVAGVADRDGVGLLALGLGHHLLLGEPCLELDLLLANPHGGHAGLFGDPSLGEPLLLGRDGVGFLHAHLGEPLGGDLSLHTLCEACLGLGQRSAASSSALAVTRADAQRTRRPSRRPRHP